MGGMTVSELAKMVGGVVVGDGTRVVESCNTLKDAGPGQVSLLHNAKYAKELETTRAGCVMISPGVIGKVKRGEGLPALTVIESSNPYFAWQKTMVRLHGHREHPRVTEPGGVSERAVVHATAKIGAGAQVHAFAVIGEGAVIGENAVIHPHVTVMRQTKIGRDTVLFPGVTIYEKCTVGEPLPDQRRDRDWLGRLQLRAGGWHSSQDSADREHGDRGRCRNRLQHHHRAGGAQEHDHWPRDEDRQRRGRRA